jgi:hypothetical protein
MTPGVRQSGVATVIFAVIILALASLVTIYTARFIRLEQSLTNNNTRAKSSFEAAEAGLAAAVSYLDDGRDRDDNDVIDPVFDTDNDGIGDSNSAAIEQARVSVALAASGAEVSIAATGFSDDRSATHTVEVLVVPADPVPSPLDVPLITKGNMIINGSATVHNPEGHFSIWGGDEVDLGSNNSTATNVADIGGTGYPGCMDTPMTCSTIRSSNKMAVGLDVIENDSTLGNLSPAGLFTSFFGYPPVTYRDRFVSLEVTGADANARADLATHEVIWVEGDVAFENNLTVGCEIRVTGGNFCLDADTEPSILIVNGNATFDGTAHFVGLVFVMGDVDISGNTTVVGMMVVAGDTESTTGGSLDLWYHSEILNELHEIGPQVPVAGTWKDF